MHTKENTYMNDLCVDAYRVASCTSAVQVVYCTGGPF
jgi:hypothetical protein